MVWVDADVELFSSVPTDLARRLCQDDLVYCYTQKVKSMNHIESGFVIFNKQHHKIADIVDGYKDRYHNQTVLEMDKPWDGFVLAEMVHGSLRPYSQISPTPFRDINFYMKHHVGKTKFHNQAVDKYLGR